MAFLLISAMAPAIAEPLPEGAMEFIDRFCSSCHNDVDREGGLDLTTLEFISASPENTTLWVKIHDRVSAGEMPPAEKRKPAASERDVFINSLAATLRQAEAQATQREGRAVRRRLNRSEYENAIRDLLQSPWLQIREQLPEDGEAFHFNKVAEALDISHVHMVRYLRAAEYALRQVIAAELVRPESMVRRYYARESLTWGNQDGNPDRGRFPVFDHGAARDVLQHAAPLTVGDTNREVRAREAMAWTSSNYAAGFNSIWNSFRAPATGRYRLRFSGYSIWVGPNGIRRPTLTFLGKTPKGGNPFEIAEQLPEWFRPNHREVFPGRRYEPIVVYALGAGGNRRLGAFDVQPDATVSELSDVWLMANDLIATDAVRFFRSRPTEVADGYTNPLAQRDGVPGVAFQWMEIEGPIHDAPHTAGYELLFGNLPLQQAARGGVSVDHVVRVPARRADGFGGPEGGTVIEQANVDVTPSNRDADAERLLRHFITRAYRHAPEEAHVQRILGLVRDRLAAGLGFGAAMLAGYTAVLTSPEFLFVEDQPGPLTDEALATRLALFLWNSAPDEALRVVAQEGRLHEPAMMAQQADRMLADAKSRRFVDAFLDYWLELRRLGETTPSITLYNDYYLDDALVEAAVDETRLFFADLLQRDLPARHVADSDFTYLNDRLARHYGIPGVNGVAMRRVALPPDSPRGGFMTQASVLKVTANGTTTSPVVRGKWVMERIVGLDLPPPPAVVPAVEPDIRGAVTIRQQLEKHRADESCAKCHRKIDPAGFALESFDILGGWRERYRATSVEASPERGFGKNGWPFSFHLAQPVDPSGRLPDGRAFEDVRDLKRLFLADEAQIARNLARQLAVYATGAPIRFGDRAAIEEILRKARGRDYGVRTIVRELIQSDLFRQK